MNRKPGKARKNRRAIRPWTYPQARAALPYLRSVLQSVREHRLDALHHGLRSRRLAERLGRPDRAALLAREEARGEASAAQEKFEDAVLELNRLDVFCLDPVGGLALVPFVHDEQLAWFVFDLFAEDALESWRFHEDPLEMRRPIGEVADLPAA